MTKSASLDDIRQAARALAPDAIRTLGKTSGDKRATAASRTSAAMKILKLAFGGDALKQPTGGSVTELLEGLDTVSRD